MLSKKKYPLISILLPTYNSEETLEKTLIAIREQTIPQNEIEILVIDGGSTDATVEIARKYDSVVILNEKKLPLYAIEIGYRHAKGKYLIKTASDESFVNKNQLAKRLKAFSEHKNLQCISSNRLITPSYDKKNFSRSYLNMFGDPFTAFVYRTKNSVIKSFHKNILQQIVDGLTLIRVESGKPYPIMDGAATMFNLEIAKKRFAKESTEMNFLLQIAEKLALDTGVVGYIEGDDIIHLPKATFRGYLSKIKYRIINNIFNIGASGYTNIAKEIPELNIRKYLFALYSMSIVLPFFQSVYFAFKYKDATLLMHFVYTEYTYLMIIYYMIRKLCGKLDENKNYG